MNPMSDEENARKRGLQQEDIDAAMSSKRGMRISHHFYLDQLL